MGNLEFGVLSILMKLNSFMKVIFLYLVVHFSTFNIKICYHGRKN